MPRAHIIRKCQIQRTPRVMQIEGIFDITPTEKSVEKWDINLDLPETWNIGLIVGPSGSGKSTIMNELFGVAVARDWEWPFDKSILDAFPENMSIKDIAALLSSVGFSTPPAWLRPFRVLSNGEQFRVSMARTLAEMPDLAVVDEFTSVIDRIVAQIGSAAIAKTIRRRNQQFVAVTCHYDVIEWLEPDWVYQPHIDEFTKGCLQRRPNIELTIQRVHHSAWKIFKKHHYLDTNLNTSAACFVAFLNNRPVAFSSWLHFVSGSRQNTKREHRTVCLPDYQGVGIGNRLSDFCASVIKGLGFDVISTTSNPAMIYARNRSPNWEMTKIPARNIPGGKFRKDKRFHFAFNRLTAGFEYIGPAIDENEARMIWGD